MRYLESDDVREILTEVYALAGNNAGVADYLARMMMSEIVARGDWDDEMGYDLNAVKNETVGIIINSLI